MDVGEGGHYTTRQSKWRLQRPFTWKFSTWWWDSRRRVA